MRLVNAAAATWHAKSHAPNISCVNQFAKIGLPLDISPRQQRRAANRAANKLEAVAVGAKRAFWLPAIQLKKGAENNSSQTSLFVSFVSCRPFQRTCSFLFRSCRFLLNSILLLLVRLVLLTTLYYQISQLSESSGCAPITSIIALLDVAALVCTSSIFTKISR
jgi:hypothetical protein